MVQNISSAVMQQRQITGTDDLDDFPTPPWAARAFVQYVLKPSLGVKPAALMSRGVCWEPAANRGYLAKGLRGYFARTVLSDIFDYGGPGLSKIDFLTGGAPPSIALTDWRDADLHIITNPPFVHALAFIQRAMLHRWTSIGIFARIAILEGADRYNGLFAKHPPTVVAPFVERVAIHKGILRNPNIKYFDEASGTWKKPSTATSYCWLLWLDGAAPRPPIWIPPCRRLLEREGDYPDATPQPMVGLGSADAAGHEGSTESDLGKDSGVPRPV